MVEPIITVSHQEALESLGSDESESLILVANKGQHFI
jgi:hypothetical protein